MSLPVIGIWVVVIGVLFAVAWRKGYLLRLSTYVQQTREELRKCTWPSWEELKGSTVLVSIAIALIAAFTMLADWVFVHVMFWISKA